MNFHDELQTLITRLQEATSGYKFTLSPDTKGLIFVSSDRKDGNIPLQDFYDIIAVVENFCQFREYNFKKNKGDIHWWQGKKNLFDSYYQIGVGFPIYIEE